MKTMLVVEDDILSQDVMKRIFKKEFEIDVCDSAEEYYEKFANNVYSIIIMDVSLKGSKHGLELVKEMKMSELNQKTPIICLTAHTQSTMRQNALDAGCDMFMNKPVANSIIKEAVASLVKENCS